jgi:hypothetical protein
MAETPAEYNAKVIGEFRANRGRVGGIWEGTPLLLLHHIGAKSGVSRVKPSRTPARRCGLPHLGRERRGAEPSSLVPEPQDAPSREDRGR